MSTDYMPTSDAGFDIFQDNFINGVQPKLMLWGIPTTEFNALTSLRIAWNMAWLKGEKQGYSQSR